MASKPPLTGGASTEGAGAQEATVSSVRQDTTHETLRQLTTEFAQEFPKMDAAVKNYISYLSALKLSGNDFQDFGDKLTIQHITALSRYLLNGLNTATLLPTPVEYGDRYPQAENQTGVDRLDELTKYRVAYGVGNQLAEQGGKRTRFFGASVRGSSAPVRIL